MIDKKEKACLCIVMVQNMKGNGMMINMYYFKKRF